MGILIEQWIQNSNVLLLLNMKKVKNQILSGPQRPNY